MHCFLSVIHMCRYDTVTPLCLLKMVQYSPRAVFGIGYRCEGPTSFWFWQKLETTVLAHLPFLKYYFRCAGDQAPNNRFGQGCGVTPVTSLVSSANPTCLIGISPTVKSISHSVSVRCKTGHRSKGKSKCEGWWFLLVSTSLSPSLRTDFTTERENRKLNM